LRGKKRLRWGGGSLLFDGVGGKGIQIGKETKKKWKRPTNKNLRGGKKKRFRGAKIGKRGRSRGFGDYL